MLGLGAVRSRDCQGVSRRSLLQVGGCSALGLGLPHWFGLDAAASERKGRVKSVLLLWLWGGPSHHETWDPKPKAPSNVRGSFGPIATAVPGTFISELLPLSARHADKFAIIRSMAHDMKDHNQAGTVSLTGSKDGSRASGGIPLPGRVRPCMGSLVSFLKRREAGDWPAYTVVGPVNIVSGAPILGQGAEDLGAPFDPFRLESFSYEDGFRVPAAIELQPDLAGRLDGRRDLLGQLNSWQRAIESSPDIRRFDDLRLRALAMLTSSAAKRALDISSEPEALRQRYGWTQFGQNCILGRRLVESGVPFVQINWSGDAEDEQQGGDGGWDLHYRLFERMQDRYCPIFDRAFTALLDDLESRGLLDSTLVLAMGEFGRSPEISSIGGREHWPFVYSLAVAGGGVAGGQVIGASSADGGHPASSPIHPSDLIATILEKMGLDRQELFARNVAVFGSPIPELG